MSKVDAGGQMTRPEGSTASRPLTTRLPVLALGASISIFAATLGLAQQSDGGVHYLDQGTKWTQATRSDFYAADQGSQLIRLSWLKALTQADGRPFLDGALTRYGYLANPDATLPLPIGFTVAGAPGAQFVGITCSACHTRQIEVDGASYRIDGGPALSDFQSFLLDLDQSVGRVLASDADFTSFANAVLGPSVTSSERATLRQDVSNWYQRQHTLFTRALPSEPWGVGRLDAVSMIFDRVSGLDIASTPDGVIADNIKPADAPVRYPFVWDAPKQDKTQWPGFAANGDDLLGVVRNLGEVYGVFATFHPVKTQGPIGWSFDRINSANFSGIDHLESLVRDIGPPAWPWAIDQGAANRGAQLFAANCASCHQEDHHGEVRFFPLSQTWKTPLVDAGTDAREYDVLNRVASTGILKGALYMPGKHLQASDTQFNILKAAVIGSMFDQIAHHGLPRGSLLQPLDQGLFLHQPAPLKKPQDEVNEAFRADPVPMGAMGTPHPYEARVLHGIWATAPYLHNGSVPSLAELLKPDTQRVATFALGNIYDTRTVGLAVQQHPGAPVRQTTDCANRASGNSRCGHNYGTTLRGDQKADLIEYLKSL